LNSSGKNKETKLPKLPKTNSDSSQDAFADRYKQKYTTDTRGITSLVASLKRTRTALNSIQAELSHAGQLAPKDKEVLLQAMQILQKLGSTADRAKIDVKRHAAEQQKVQERLRKESTAAVTAAFPSEQIEEAVAYLVWDHKVKRYSGTYNWRSNLREELKFDSYIHKYRTPNVVGELKTVRNDLIREIISSVAMEAETNGRSVIEIVAEIKADFNEKRGAILEKETGFIQEIKTAAVAQTLEARVRKGPAN
jgi:hypothetical protein